MQVYENKENVVDRSLLEKEKIPFAVLYRVLGGPVKKVVTDHQNSIIAHTAPIFPTWIWMRDGAGEAELEVLYQTLQKEFSPLSAYRFNTKYWIAEYLLKRWKEDGQHVAVNANIASYACPVPRKPEKEVDGQRELLGVEQVELAARMIRESSQAIGDVILSEEESIAAAKEQLDRQVLYIWRDGSGKPVSFCDKRAESDQYTAVSQCYTVPEARGKQYAGHLIYGVCQEILQDGQIPILYADADYRSSNRCYQKIGFVLQEKIVMIGPEC